MLALAYRQNPKEALPIFGHSCGGRGQRASNTIMIRGSVNLLLFEDGLLPSC